MKFRTLFIRDLDLFWGKLKYLYAYELICLVLAVVSATVGNAFVQVVAYLPIMMGTYAASIVPYILMGVLFYRHYVGKQSSFYHMLPVPKKTLILAKALAYAVHTSVLSITSMLLGGFSIITMSGTIENGLHTPGMPMTQTSQLSLAEVLKRLWDAVPAWLTVLVIIGLLVFVFFSGLMNGLLIGAVMQPLADSRFAHKRYWGPACAALIAIAASIVLSIGGIALIAFFLIGLAPHTLQPDKIVFYVFVYMMAYMALLTLLIGVVSYGYTKRSMERRLQV